MKYPPVKSADGGNQGVGPHYDGQFVTLVGIGTHTATSRQSTLAHVPLTSDSSEIAAASDR